MSKKKTKRSRKKPTHTQKEKLTYIFAAYIAVFSFVISLYANVVHETMKDLGEGWYGFYSMVIAIVFIVLLLILKKMTEKVIDDKW